MFRAGMWSLHRLWSGRAEGALPGKEQGESGTSETVIVYIC